MEDKKLQDMKPTSVNDTDKVVHSNELIPLLARFSKVQLKILEVAIASIDTKNPPKDNTVYIKKKELFSLLGVTDSDRYYRFEKYMDEAFDIKLRIPNSENKVMKLRPISYTEWSLKDRDQYVLIEFSSRMMPYLLDLKKNFLQYQVRETLNLTSKYSIILYKFFISKWGLYKKYRNSSFSNPTISVEEIRFLTGTSESYDHFPIFERRVLKEPIEDICKNTSLAISYKKNKVGRKIESITFYIQDNNEAYTMPISEEKAHEEYYSGLDTRSPIDELYSVIMLEFKLSLGDRDKESLAKLTDFYSYDDIYEGIKYMLIQKKESFELRLLQTILKNRYWEKI